MAQTITIDSTPGFMMPTLYYSQNDIGRAFVINVASRDGFSIPAGATVKMQATKPSGFGFSVTGTVSSNSVTFTTTDEMTDEAGRFPAELVISASGNVIGTANFWLEGEKNPHPVGTTDGSEETVISELTLLVERVEAAASNILDMTVTATTLAAGSQATYSYDEDTNTATFGIPQGEAGAGAAGVVASAYSSSKTYAVGDYVIHNSNLYRCTTAITTAESFTAAHWTQVVLADDVSDVKSDISYLDNEVFIVSTFNWQSIATTDYPTGFRTGYYHTDGTVKSSSHAVRSISNISFDDCKRITLQAPSGKMFRICEYLSNGTFSSMIEDFGSGGQYFEFVPTVGRKYSFSFGNWTESITNADLTNSMINGFVLTQYKSVIDNIETALTTCSELSADRSITIPDSTDFDSLTAAGTYKVTNNTHAATMSNMPAPVAGKLFVILTSQVNRIVQLYIADALARPAQIYTRFIQITTGGTNITDWRYLPDSEQAVLKAIDIKHESGSYASGKATERITIRIFSANGLILYRLYHFVDADNNCDGWQIFSALKVDKDGSNQTEITLTGEWECAVHLADRDDFSGGHTHGDEVMTGAMFLVDGVPTTISDLTDYTSCEDFRVIQTSELYDPDDHTTVIANHGKEYVFTRDGLTLHQSLEWLVAENLTNCFLAMFLPRKDMIDRAIANTDFETLELPSASGTPLTTITKPNANNITMWDTSTGVFADISVPVYPTGLTGGDKATISDNGGLNYNKVYFYVCTGGTSSVGELWKSTTVYKLGYKA